MLVELTEEEACACLVALQARAEEFAMCARDENGRAHDEEGNRVPMNAAQAERWGWWSAVADKIAAQMEAPND